MATQPPRTSSEELAIFRANTHGSQSVFFYIVLGVISGARKLLLKANTTNTAEITRPFSVTPSQSSAAPAQESAQPTITALPRPPAPSAPPAPRSFFGKFQRPKQ